MIYALIPVCTIHLVSLVDYVSVNLSLFLFIYFVCAADIALLKTRDGMHMDLQNINWRVYLQRRLDLNHAPYVSYGLNI